jgi:hypothetical protein
MKPQACADRKLTEETDVFGGYFEIFNQTSILLCVGCTREEAAQCSQQHTACSKVPVSRFCTSVSRGMTPNEQKNRVTCLEDSCSELALAALKQETSMMKVPASFWQSEATPVR